MKRKPDLAALLFLGLMAAGACMLFSGLVDRGPEYTGMALPSMTGYAAHRGMGGARQVPDGHRGSAVALEAEPLLDRAQAAISAAEPAANAALDRQHWFIQLYGGVQTLSGRTVVDDADPQYSVVKLSDGTLTFVNSEEKEVSDHGRLVARLRDVLADREIPLLYVQAPQKVQADDPRLPQEVTDQGNAYADQVLAVLEEQEVDCLDLRPLLAEMDGEWSQWFFRTDHHWTPQAAFTAHQLLADVLREDYDFAIDPRHTDPDRFLRTTYQDYFLGSQGKRVGTLYGGVDDIELWIPDYLTEFTYSIPASDTVRTGTMDRSLLFPERVEEVDYFNGNPYTLYAGGDYSMARIYNNRNPGGKRVLLLRDSFACAITPFLALDCGELITMDLRYFHDRLLTYVDWLQPDMVILLYAPGSCGQDTMFDFFHDPGQTDPYLAACLDQPTAVTLTRPGQVTDLWDEHRKG